MIIISEETARKIKERPCIAEIVSFPDAGSTSACVKLGSFLVEEDKAAAIFFSSFNTPNAKYISKLVPEDKAQQFLMIEYKSYDRNFIPETIARLAPLVRFFIIDDFYNFVLYKNYTFIREFMKRIAFLKNRYGISICLVNQLRHVIRTEDLDFDTGSAMKSLYFEHLKPFVDIRIGISKDESSDIHVDLLEEKAEEKESALGRLLSSLA